LFATVAGGTDSGRLDATVAAPGPHDFAVRELSVSSGEDHLTLAAAIASRAQRVVTIMIRPSAGQDGRKIVPICGIVKSYFGKIVWRPALRPHEPAHGRRLSASGQKRRSAEASVASALGPVRQSIRGL